MSKKASLSIAQRSKIVIRRSASVFRDCFFVTFVSALSVNKAQQFLAAK